MDADDECDGRPCVACGRVVQDREVPPYRNHAADCALVAEWGRVLTREEVRALLDEGKRIATEKRKAREARERDPERAR